MGTVKKANPDGALETQPVGYAQSHAPPQWTKGLDFRILLRCSAAGWVFGWLQALREAGNPLGALQGRLCGQRPVGWYTGRVSPNTRALAVEHGMQYDSAGYNDDLPYWAEVGGRRQLVLSYSFGCNDMRFASAPGFNTPDDFADHLRRTLACLHRACTCTCGSRVAPAAQRPCANFSWRRGSFPTSGCVGAATLRISGGRSFRLHDENAVPQPELE